MCTIFAATTIQSAVATATSTSLAELGTVTVQPTSSSTPTISDPVVREHAPAMRPFTASLPMALLKAREASMRHFRPMLANHDLTEQQWRVLRALTASDSALTVGDVAERTFLLGPSLTRILANLEGRRLIRRSVSSNDHRRSNIQLTKAGRSLVRTVAPTSETIYHEIEAEFGAERLRRLLTELDALAQLGLDNVYEEETA